MPHGAVDSTKATAQNATTEPQPPSDQARGDEQAANPEARTYAAPDFRDASLAMPAAGEVGDYADLDEPSGGMAQGRTHNDRERHAHTEDHGPKTQAANRKTSGEGSA